MRQRASRNAPKPRRALAVMAKVPRAGAVKTRLSPLVSPADAARFAEAFLTDTLRTAAAPVLRADTLLFLDGLAEPYDVSFFGAPPGVSVFPQRGNSLGERLVQVMAMVFERGYESVCVIGSDTPHLPAAHLLEAWGRLATGADIVLGPSDDGGYTLIALPRPTPELFDEIPWSTPNVLEATIHQATQAGRSVSLLPPWYDIDTPEDLLRLRRDLRRGVVTAPMTEDVLEKVGLS